MPETEGCYFPLDLNSVREVTRICSKSGLAVFVWCLWNLGLTCAKSTLKGIYFKLKGHLRMWNPKERRPLVKEREWAGGELDRCWAC